VVRYFTCNVLLVTLVLMPLGEAFGSFIHVELAWLGLECPSARLTGLPSAKVAARILCSCGTFAYNAVCAFNAMEAVCSTAVWALCVVACHAMRLDLAASATLLIHNRREQQR
jgi:hypothetical protein